MSKGKSTKLSLGEFQKVVGAVDRNPLPTGPSGRSSYEDRRGGMRGGRGGGREFRGDREDGVSSWERGGGGGGRDSRGRGGYDDYERGPPRRGGYDDYDRGPPRRGGGGGGYDGDYGRGPPPRRGGGGGYDDYDERPGPPRSRADEGPWKREGPPGPPPERGGFSDNTPTNWRGRGSEDDLPPPPRARDYDSGRSERPRLKLKPRSIPKEDDNGSQSSSSLFGGAQPVDTAAREEEVISRKLGNLKTTEEGEEEESSVKAGEEASGESSAEPVAASLTRSESDGADTNAAATEAEASSAPQRQRTPTPPIEKVQSLAPTRIGGSWRDREAARGGGGGGSDSRDFRDRDMPRRGGGGMGPRRGHDDDYGRRREDDYYPAQPSRGVGGGGPGSLRRFTPPADEDMSRKRDGYDRTGTPPLSQQSTRAPPADKSADVVAEKLKAEKEKQAQKAEEAAKRAAEQEAKRKAQEEAARKAKEELERKREEALEHAKVAKELISSGVKGKDLVESAKALGSKVKGSALLAEILQLQESPETLAKLEWLTNVEYGPVLKILLASSDRADQVDAVYSVQKVVERHGYPKVDGDPLIEKIFHALYGADILDEEAFTSWRDDEREEGNKRKAVVQTTPWFLWLEAAEEDEDEEEDFSDIEELNNI